MISSGYLLCASHWPLESFSNKEKRQSEAVQFRVKKNNKCLAVHFNTKKKKVMKLVPELESQIGNGNHVGKKKKQSKTTIKYSHQTNLLHVFFLFHISYIYKLDFSCLYPPPRPPLPFLTPSLSWWKSSQQDAPTCAATTLHRLNHPQPL